MKREMLRSPECTGETVVAVRIDKTAVRVSSEFEPRPGPRACGSKRTKWEKRDFEEERLRLVLNHRIPPVTYMRVKNSLAKLAASSGKNMNSSTLLTDAPPTTVNFCLGRHWQSEVVRYISGKY